MLDPGKEGEKNNKIYQIRDIVFVRSNLLYMFCGKFKHDHLETLQNSQPSEKDVHNPMMCTAEKID